MRDTALREIAFSHITLPSYFHRMTPEEKIKALRKKIDDLDDQLIDLLVKRYALSREVGHIKAKDGQSVHDPSREREIIDRLTKRAGGQLGRDDITALFKAVYRISKEFQTREK